MKRYRLKILFLCFSILSSVSVMAQGYTSGLIEKTVALIGGDMILLSELESEVQMMIMYDGYQESKNLRCEALERLMEAKLYINQAKLDSLQVNPAQIEAEVKSRMASTLTQLGGQEAAERYFGKNIYQIREDIYQRLNENYLVQLARQEVLGSVVELTPKQVKSYYNKVNKDSLPVIADQYQLSQIVLYPDVEAAAQRVREELLGYRKRIMDGDRFAMLATLYSQDPGSAFRGGELGMTSKSELAPAFSDAAMSLKVGQVSSIVETSFGFHLIQLIEKDGDMLNARHILRTPVYTIEDKLKAFTTLDSVKTLILTDSITFESAAKVYSKELSTSTNGGLLVDKNTGSSYFPIASLKPADYEVIKNMKVGEISQPFESKDDKGMDGNTIYKILKINEIIPSHTANFDDDYNVIQTMANNQNSFDALDKFIEKKIRETYIVVDPIFHNCEFVKSGWIK